MAFNFPNNFAVFAALFLALNSHFILTSSCKTSSKHENQRFCPIETKTLKSKCGHYINNGGLGVSEDCCELLRQADDVDTSLASCLCPRKLHKNRRCHRHHRDRMHEPQTAVNIVNACNLLLEYQVDLSCK
ncbi:hypothetical protein POM88_000120 [Heracleum sosnowskyi]|uniref:Bifunctional inhibitor/plant lipid transfer protein/seed storage helical domain-containing protein n=1 Tax=Heracleum sosnowskyi TaxID=360622 RepID=A0AAD8N3P6_9APIA|nr:hypothetical protein POM88_000120 [Heracleum sosnowskyi]